MFVEVDTKERSQDGSCVKGKIQCIDNDFLHATGNRLMAGEVNSLR